MVIGVDTNMETRTRDPEPIPSPSPFKMNDTTTRETKLKSAPQKGVSKAGRLVVITTDRPEESALRGLTQHQNFVRDDEGIVYLTMTTTTYSATTGLTCVAAC